MAHLWMEADGEWQRYPLHAAAHELRDGVWVPHEVSTDPRRFAGVTLERQGNRLDEAWVLLATSTRQVLVNGRRLPLGLRCLRDRDELSAQGRTWFFSTERLPIVEDFEGEADASCPRCKGVIAPGEPTVRCPACRVVYHQRADRACWTYGATCALCGGATALDGGFIWTPATL
jgi:uncharacterized C2H2 Zn-finger protein